LDQLQTTLADALTRRPPPPPRVAYPETVRADIEALTPIVRQVWQVDGFRARGLALWALTSLDDHDELEDIPPELRLAVQGRAGPGRDIDQEIIASRYAFLDQHVGRLVPKTGSRTLTDRLDQVLLHPVWGFAVFIGFMLVIFQALFSGANPFIDAIGWAVSGIATVAVSVLPPGFLTDLLVEGVIGGVGNVIVFLPQILMLFGFIGLLEDSGYMARAAYLMDRIMKSVGLHGRAFVPMMSGYACAVPAIMATRTMERKRDRLLTMMVVPLMSCSARLPVYTLIIAALFPPTRVFGVLPLQGVLMTVMYLFSTFIALVAAGVLGRTVLKGQRVPLILELPPIRLPSFQSVLRLMWSRSRVFLSEAGTIILACSVVLWGLLSYPKLPELGPGASQQDVAAWQAESLEHSYAGQLGKAIEPAIAPLGYDWKIGVGLIGAFAAREVFVSTMGLVYGVGEGADAQSISLREKMRSQRRPDGKPIYSPLTGISLMVFIALAAQCMSTLAAVQRETRSYRWPAFLFIYMTSLAWVSSFVVYQVGRLLGFG
ncbi:MAG: ferrous iron transport protein B, partial [Oligoflexia bacterium]|nr:ferrous iron transport protein B [Oligoflexia bacterium]